MLLKGRFMNKTLLHLIERFATKDHKAVKDEIFCMSKDSLEATFLDLLTMYMNDRNSSTLRETITVTLSGYTLHEKKLGFNGYRQSAPDKPEEYCEAKPVNVRFDEETQKYKRILQGAGNFSDYTFERLDKDLESNPRMLVSGFAEGKLLYILSFPFSCLRKALETQLFKQFPNRQRQKNSYFRSANFNYKDFKDCSELEVVFISEEIDDYAKALNKGFFSWLTEIKKNRQQVG